MRADLINTILDLYRQTDHNAKDMDDDSLKSYIQDNERINLDEDDDDKLDDLMLKLATKKKSSKLSTHAAIKPIKASEINQETVLKAAAVTNFEVGQWVYSKTRPQWGKGQIISIGYFRDFDNIYQKCEIEFVGGIGRKTIIAYTDLLAPYIDGFSDPSLQKSKSEVNKLR